MKESKRVWITGLAAIAAFVVVGGLWLAPATAGIGKYTSEESASLNVQREAPIDGFDTVKITHAWEVEIEHGETFLVEIDAPEDAEVYREGKTLVVGRRKGASFFDGDWDARVRLRMPDLRKLDVSGASEVDLSGFDLDALTVDVSGAVDIDTERMKVNALDVSISGAAALDMKHLEAQTLRIDSSGAAKIKATAHDATIDCSGASDIDLKMTGGKLSIDASGASSIDIRGPVSSRSVETSGLSAVDFRD